MSATVKGSVVEAGYDYMRQAYGLEVWRQVLESLDQQDRELATSARTMLRYPVATDGRVFDALVTIAFEGNRVVAESELRKGGAFQADAMLSGVFSVFARLASPRQAFLRAGSIITSVYTDVSSRTEEAAGGDGGAITIVGLAESSFVAPWHCGWIERALLHFGSTGPRVTERSWAAGRNASDELVYDIRF